MDDLQRLLAIVEGLDETKRQKEEDPPSDEDLAEARKGLREALDAAAEGDRPNLEDMRAIRSAIDVIDAAVVTREEERTKAKAEAAALLEGLDKPKAEQEDSEDEKDGEDKSEDEGDGDKEPEASKEKVTVAASLSDAITRSAKRRTERVTEQASSDWDVLVASVGVAQGAQFGNDATLEDAADLFNKYAGQVKRGSNVLIHMEKLYPEERSLGLSAQDNTRLIDAVTGPRVITAAGGVCEPLPADFSHPICGDRGRPIFNANPIFRADRGGARFAPSATVSDLESAITVWTAETDADPGSDTKACPAIDCEDELSATVDAVVACLTVGNFQARFNPEFWRSKLDLLMVAHDRVAEQTLYAEIESSSTQVTFAGGSGTVVDVLTAVDRAVAGLASRHRLIGTGYTAILPAWLRDALRAHLNNQAPAGSLDLFSVADAQLSSFFTSRRVTPVWSPDIEVSAAQGAGAINGFGNAGTDVDVVIYPNGTWMTFDGGQIDLGTSISDSTLNAQNNRQAFMETFEKAVQRGCESLSIDVPLAETCICGP